MKYFGTDGVRGIVGKDLNAELVKKVGKAIAAHGELKSVLIGNDTRQSADFIRFILTDVLTAKGIKVMHAGIVPTTALAFLTRELKADMGIMITASHNPPQHNGIKLFEGDGEKLGADKLEKIDSLIDTFAEDIRPELKTDSLELWKNYLVKKFAPVFKGKKTAKILVDYAYGVGWTAAIDVYKRLGIDAAAFNTEYDGINANANCGATHTEFMTEKMREGTEKGTIGFAFDGDADRCIVFDESGEPVHPDVFLAVIARHLKIKTLVTTVMFNTGIEKWLNKIGIEIVRTLVGERHVIAELNKLEHRNAFGGETSAHQIFPEIWAGGDGLTASLMTLKTVTESGKSLRDLCADVPLWPSILRNVIHDVPAGERWQDGCRILVRKSGTEKLTRVLIEGESLEKCENIMTEILKPFEKN